MCANFLTEILRGYNDFMGDQICCFPIDSCMGLTTVQRYCAACDSVLDSVLLSAQFDVDLFLQLLTFKFVIHLQTVQENAAKTKYVNYVSALDFFVDIALYIMNQKLCRLKCNDVQYYLLTSDKDGDLELLLTDTVNAWQGHGAVFVYSCLHYMPFNVHGVQKREYTQL